MENSQLLAVESFSYSWLSSKENSLSNFHDELARASSVDNSWEALSGDSRFMMSYCKQPPEQTQHFDFHIPVSESSSPLVHADELFSKGIIRPAFFDPLVMKTSNTLGTSSATLVSSPSPRTVGPAIRVNCRFLKRWRKFTKQILGKCLKYIPLYHEVDNSKKIHADRIAWERNSRSGSPKASSLEGRVSSSSSWPDAECFIYDAVLHCKRSLGK